jgi:hypothetical protein
MSTTEDYEGPGGGRYFSMADLPPRDEAPEPFNPEDPKTWGDGPWQNEPNRVDFRYRGFPCMILRSDVTGALCGYLGVGPSHPWYQASYDDVDVWVHGGLTYGNFCQGDLCHVPLPEDPFVNPWWLGFDCSHAWDLAPAMRALLRRTRAGRMLSDRSVGMSWEVYRDVAYVTRQIKLLAIQARRAATLRGRLLNRLHHLAGATRSAWWKLRNDVREMFDPPEDPPAFFTEESMWRMSLGGRRRRI